MCDSGGHAYTLESFKHDMNGNLPRQVKALV
jgi:hypothetical protein